MAATLGLWIVVALCTAETRRTWWRGLACTGLLVCLAPIAATRYSAAGLWGSGPQLRVVASVDAALSGAGLAFLVLAYFVRRASLRQAAAAVGSTEARAAQVLVTSKPTPQLGLRHE
jgi:hypothetical protein